MKNIVTLASIAAVILFLVIVVPPVHSKLTDKLLKLNNGMTPEANQINNKCRAGI